MDFGDFAYISKELAENAKIKRRKHYISYTYNYLACHQDKTTNHFPLFGYFQKWVDVFEAIEIFQNEIQALFVDCEV